jgi:hypothetical protein
MLSRAKVHGGFGSDKSSVADGLILKSREELFGIRGSGNDGGHLDGICRFPNIPG